MTPDELLRPRYKVIADYPDSPYSIGDIIYFQKWGGDLNKWANYDEEGQFIGFTDHFDEFPHLFKKLEWWEDRKPEEMPEYVKYWDISLYYPVDVVCRGSEAPFNAYDFTADRFLPATEAEYLEYIKQKEG